MSFKLVVTDTDWANEMDIWGFEVISTDRFNFMLEALDIAFKYAELLDVAVGSNEEIYFYKNNYMRHFKITDINQESLDVLSNTFGSLCKGYFLFEQLVDTSLDVLSTYNEEEAKRLSNLIYEE